MSCLTNLLIITAMVLAAPSAAPAQKPTTYNLGRTPTSEEIRAWDIAIGPAGKELPPGSGTAQQGAKIYAQRCAQCHGPTGMEKNPTGFPRNPLVGGKGTIGTIHEVKTIGSEWPYATTVWDFINRAMPPNQEGSLSADDVYALTAFLLCQNGIVGESDVIDAKSLPKVQMPNRNAFVPPLPLPKWSPRTSMPYGIYP
jgi:mono/diheme cytochrome c family protein